MMACFSSGVSQWSRGTRALCSLALPYRLPQAKNLPRAMPIQPTNRSAEISVLSDHSRTKSTTASRTSGGTQRPIRSRSAQRSSKVLQRLALPLIEQARLKSQLVAKVRHRHLVHHVPSQDLRLLIRGEGTSGALRCHDGSPRRVCTTAALPSRSVRGGTETTRAARSV